MCSQQQLAAKDIRKMAIKRENCSALFNQIQQELECSQ